MKTKFNYTVVVLTVFILIFLVGYWFFLVPQFRQISTNLQELNQTDTLVAKKSVDKQGRQEQIAVVKNSAELLLPTTDKQYDLSVELEAAAKNSGVTITSLAITSVAPSLPQTTSVTNEEDSGSSASSTPLPAAKAPAAPVVTLNKLTVSMTVAGSYQAVQQWVERVTSLDRFIGIDQLHVTSGTATQGSSQISGQISAFAYYLPSANKGAATP